MEFVNDAVGWLNGIVWGPYMLVLILGTGLFLTLGLKIMPWRKISYGFRMLWVGRQGRGEGDISGFNALMTSLSATVGTGNIAGVGTAVAIGGPGAVFWMWCTALVGMATKYGEAVLAVRYREVNEEGQHVGGPMYYIRNGLGENWKWLATAFAIFGAIAGFGIGNMVQSNSVADVLHAELDISREAAGFGMALLVFPVLIGGLQRIARVASALVPFMAIAYVLGGLLVIALHISEVPSAIETIIEAAFTPTAATGGFAGAAVALALQYGVARGIFSNEAGLGSAPIAHASAKTDDPVRQGTVAMLGTFIDTLIICTITALVIVTTGAWKDVNPKFEACVGSGGAVVETLGVFKPKVECVLKAKSVVDGEEVAIESKVKKVVQGASLSSTAFNQGLPVVGGWIVAFGMVLFAFTTILGWSVYGERCVEYLFGVGAVLSFRVLWVLAIPLGALVKLDFVWLLADTLNGLMAVPNLIALILLGPVVFKVTKDYFAEAGNKP